MADITWQGAITIKAPVEQVYRYLADLPRHAEWAQSVVELELVRPGDASGLGARYRTAERQSWQTDRRPRAPLLTGTAGTTMCEVRELVPHRRIAWVAWAPVPGVVHEGDYAFDLVAEDGQHTRLTQTNRLHDNWLGTVVSTLVFKTTPAKARAQWAASLANIKTILEAEVPADQPAAPAQAAAASSPTRRGHVGADH
jgi:uncharacterized protein YndB with AHSA1/START domain